MTSQIQSTTIESLPKQFVQAMRTLFDIMDDKRTGFVDLQDIEHRWQDDGNKGLPKGVIESLQKVTPPNGKLSFERFCAGLKICLLRNQVENRNQKNSSTQPNRPPSAPLLDIEGPTKSNWSSTNTAAVRPNVISTQRTLSMPQLLAKQNSADAELQNFENQKTVPNTQKTLYGPPKPPRSAPNLEKPFTSQNFDRAEIRTALQNWQIGVLMNEDKSIKGYSRNRGSGDGKPSTQAEIGMYQKKNNPKRREPRRHTLQNGIDYNMLKRMKQIEQEKDVLMQGLQAVERARDWYLKQVAAVQEKMKYLGRSGTHMDHYSEAQQERLELQRARVLEVNRHLATLTDSWERGGLPLHMNLAVHHHSSPNYSPDMVSRLKQQNHLLTEVCNNKSIIRNKNHDHVAYQKDIRPNLTNGLTDKIGNTGTETENSTKLIGDNIENHKMEQECQQNNIKNQQESTYQPNRTNHPYVNQNERRIPQNQTQKIPSYQKERPENIVHRSPISPNQVTYTPGQFGPEPISPSSPNTNYSGYPARNYPENYLNPTQTNLHHPYQNLVHQGKKVPSAQISPQSPTYPINIPSGPIPPQNVPNDAIFHLRARNHQFRSRNVPGTDFGSPDRNHQFRLRNLPGTEIVSPEGNVILRNSGQPQGAPNHFASRDIPDFGPSKPPVAHIGPTENRFHFDSNLGPPNQKSGLEFLVSPENPVSKRFSQNLGDFLQSNFVAQGVNQVHLAPQGPISPEGYRTHEPNLYHGNPTGGNQNHFSPENSNRNVSYPIRSLPGPNSPQEITQISSYQVRTSQTTQNPQGIRKIWNGQRYITICTSETQNSKTQTQKQILTRKSSFENGQPRIFEDLTGRSRQKEEITPKNVSDLYSVPNKANKLSRTLSEVPRNYNYYENIEKEEQETPKIGQLSQENLLGKDLVGEIEDSQTESELEAILYAELPNKTTTEVQKEREKTKIQTKFSYKDGNYYEITQLTNDYERICDYRQIEKENKDGDYLTSNNKSRGNFTQDGDYLTSDQTHGNLTSKNDHIYSNINNETSGLLSEKELKELRNKRFSVNLKDFYRQKSEEETYQERGIDIGDLRDNKLGDNKRRYSYYGYETIKNIENLNKNDFSEKNLTDKSTMEQPNPENNNENLYDQKATTLNVHFNEIKTGQIRKPTEITGGHFDEGLKDVSNEKNYNNQKLRIYKNDSEILYRDKNVSISENFEDSNQSFEPTLIKKNQKSVSFDTSDSLNKSSELVQNLSTENEGTKQNHSFLSSLKEMKNKIMLKKTKKHSTESPI